MKRDDGNSYASGYIEKGESIMCDHDHGPANDVESPAN